MSHPNKILITLGDASGIGPEIIVKTLKELSAAEKENIEILGERWVLEEISRDIAPELSFCSSYENEAGKIKVKEFGLLSRNNIRKGSINSSCGNASYHYFSTAIELCQNKLARAIVTAPIHKEALNKAGHKFLGHTDILEKKVGAPTVMSIWHPKFVVSHVSDHVPLKKAIEMLTAQRLKRVVKELYNGLQKMGCESPRIAVAGLNPHAGENGILGSEELEIIIPCLQELKKEGYPSIGPVSADTMFFSALNGKYDGLVAMYHDQGFAPMKTLDMPNCVNFTLGLPFVRTSPDHGTAFDLAGKNSADHRSMLAAFKLAQRLIA